MIDPKLLTSENGFEDGVVVEIEWDTYPITGNDKEIAYWEDAKEWSTEYMESIRPLTGTMSIWNNAPEWAETCMIWPFDSRIEWIKKGGEVKTIGMATFTERPFWARGAGNE